MTNDVSISKYIIVLICLFALLGYTCVISCITYLMVPKSHEKIKKNDDIEENNECNYDIPTHSNKKLCVYVCVYVSMCVCVYVCTYVFMYLLPLTINTPTIKPLDMVPIVCNKTNNINELIRIEKKIAFYDIRQHHINVDFKSDMVNPGGGGEKRNFVEVLTGKNGNSKKLVLEYWIRINNINSSMFDKKSDELLIYTNGPYDRSENVGYTIDNKFIDELLLNPRCGMCDGYRFLLQNAYYLHNKFYTKLKEAYKKIEDKYNSIPHNFEDFDKLVNEVQINENEMDVLEEFDSKRRKLEIREMILLFDLKPYNT